MLVHSIIIGVALGVSDDTRFTPLLVAVAFHQLFEGLALGILVSEHILKPRHKIILGLMYPLTTPLGIGIGMGVHERYNENTHALILSQGILNSLSAGILIYSTYCELVGGEINHNPVFDAFTKPFKVLCFLFMYLGAACMAVLGYWA